MAPTNTPIGTLERIAQGVEDPQAAAKQALAEQEHSVGWLADAMYRGDRIDFDRVGLDQRREAARLMGRTYDTAPPVE